MDSARDDFRYDNSDSDNSKPTGDKSSGGLITVESKVVRAPNAISWAHGVPSRPEILSQKPDLIGLSRALRRRLWLAVGLGLLVGSALAAAAWVLIPVRYTASVLFTVRSRPPFMMEAPAATDYLDYKKTQKEYFRSPFLLRAALNQPGINKLSMVTGAGEDKISWLQSQISAEYLGDSELLQVSLRGENPNETAMLINAVKKAYVDQIVENEKTQRMVRKDSLDKQRLIYAKDLEQKKNEFDNLADKAQSKDSDAALLRRDALLRQLQNLQQQQAETHKAYLQLSTDLMLGKQMVESKANGNMTDAEMESRVNSDPRIAQMLAQQAELSRQIREAAGAYKRKNDPALVRMNQNMRALDDDLQVTREQVRMQIKDLVMTQDSAKGNFQMLQMREPLLKNQILELGKQINIVMDQITKFATSSAAIESLRREIDQLKQLQNQVSMEYAKTDLELQNTDSRVKPGEDAEAPSKNNAIWKYVQVGFASAFGLSLVMFGIALWEFQSRRLNTAEEMVEGLGVRVIGSLPSLRQSRVGFHRRSKDELQTMILESVDSIRTSLIHTLHSPGGSVVLITSAHPHEGKTTVASQLASSLARSGKRTLLVDGDLRHPGAHMVLGMPMDRGLAEILRGEAELDDVVRPTQAENLWFLSAGQICRTSIQALSRKRVPEVLESLRSGFDFVVIDSSPVLSVADARLLGQHVDGAVLSVLKDVSQIPQVYEACELLRAVGIRLLGAVVNGAEPVVTYQYASRKPAIGQTKIKKQKAGKVKVRSAKSKNGKRRSESSPNNDSEPSNSDGEELS